MVALLARLMVLYAIYSWWMSRPIKWRARPTRRPQRDPTTEDLIALSILSWFYVRWGSDEQLDWMYRMWHNVHMWDQEEFYPSRP